eukprot:CAMPEP_0197515438 /NCGR_PEP_ID=MMETSP1318-20131121/575_1 /TAXON_ID=552666 /ORGANISM="Partenskyella glossopodia, Strain RCC365" /LENGTH=134 /DNA_ID=CAMNT_0043063813 /DNA_START=18 /DNA_END=422 /DNA_ORIENTATION=+
MVQGGKLRQKSIGGKKKGHGRKRYISNKRKKGGLPKRGVSVVKKSKHERKVSTAINKNIEEIMASRFISEGGRLCVVATPKNVQGFVKSGPSLGKNARNKTFSRAAKRKTKDKKLLDEQLKKLEMETAAGKKKK